MLKSLTERAERGEVVAIGVVSVGAGREVATQCAGDGDPADLAWGLRSLLWKIEDAHFGGR